MEDLNGKNQLTKMTIKYSISRLLTYSIIFSGVSLYALEPFNLPNWVILIPIILLLYFDPKKPHSSLFERSGNEDDFYWRL
jgi:hypothetical protein